MICDWIRYDSRFLYYYWIWSRYEFFYTCDNNKNDIIILDEGPTQGLDGATLTAENFEIAATPLCLGRISKDFSEDNMKILYYIISYYII